MQEGKAKSYLITPKNDESFTVRAHTYQEAARIGSNRMHGRNATAKRTTGDPGKSGYFQSYKHVRGENALSSVGEPFHVS